MAAPARRSTAEEDASPRTAAPPPPSPAGLSAAEETLVRRCLSERPRTLEGGTADGRIVAALVRRGFADLHAFDVDAVAVEAARRREPSGVARLTVQEPTRLSYNDGRFDQVLYLRDVLCLLDDAGDRRRALQEAWRVTAPGGVAIFGFLCHETRTTAWAPRLYGRYLAAIRRARGRAPDVQRRPWEAAGPLRRSAALLDRRPHAYWWRIDEAVALLREAGFTIESAGSTAQLERGELLDRPEQLDAGTVEGRLYVVCTRPRLP
jgi:SAM-dependent methyltransferase